MKKFLTKIKDDDEQTCKDYTKAQLKRRIPIFEWLPKYEWRENFLMDFIAGLTIACICVPQGLAFAVLANVSPIYGLNSCCIPTFIYAVFGTAKFSSFGAVSLTSIMVGEALSRVSPNPNYTIEQWVSTLTLIVGLYYFLFFFLRFYYVTVVFKKPFVSAFLAAIAFYIMQKSVRLVLGIPDKGGHSGILNLVYNTIDLFKNLHQASYPTVIVSGVVILIFCCNQIFLTPYIARYTRYVVPVETLVMMIIILISYCFDFSDMGIPIVGDVPMGLPSLTVPSARAFTDTWLIAVPIAAVNYATTVTNVMVFNPDLDPEQEVLAMSIANVFCCFFECFVFGNSMMRALIAIDLGIKSLLSTAITALLMFIIILCAGPIFGPLPKSVLGCIMLIAVIKLLYMRILDIKFFYKSFEDMMIFIVTFLTTLLTTVEIGLVIGLLLSLRKILESLAKEEMIPMHPKPVASVFKPERNFSNLEEKSSELVIPEEKFSYLEELKEPSSEAVVPEEGKKSLTLSLTSAERKKIME